MLAAIAAHARAEAPRECCGLLLGPAMDTSGAVTDIAVSRAEPTRNVAAVTTRYDIDPADHFRVIRQARAAGLAVIGAYHSHPTSAPVPSPTDLAEGWPNFLYLIATLRPLEPAIRAYLLDGPSYRELRVAAGE